MGAVLIFAGALAIPAKFSAQAKNTFENLTRCLALPGASFKDVFKIDYFVTDLSKTTELRQIRAQYLDSYRSGVVKSWRIADIKAGQIALLPAHLA